MLGLLHILSAKVYNWKRKEPPVEVPENKQKKCMPVCFRNFDKTT